MLVYNNPHILQYEYKILTQNLRGRKDRFYDALSQEVLAIGTFFWFFFPFAYYSL